MSAPEAKPASGDAKPKFLKKAEREKCWGARDKFWQCMTANKEEMEKCLETRKGFEEMCPHTWVTHFDRKFQYEKFKVELNTKGYKTLDEDFRSKSKK